jgi:outer membrane protein OmpA-like peptidoglycan-associated protein
MKTYTTLLVLISFVAILMLGACATPGKGTGIGAGAGAGVGAAIGGAAGGWKGAGLGALAGGALGVAVGNYLDKQNNELKKVAETKRTEDGILVNLKNDLLFDTGSDVLKPEAVDQLTQLGQILSKYKKDRVRVEGFTDDVGGAAFNQELSMRRATAVKNVLLDHGVSSDQLLVYGYGESKPIASNTSQTGRSKNRRVELYIDVPQDGNAGNSSAPSDRQPAASSTVH